MNYIDLIILCVLIYAMYQGYKRGLIIGVLGLVSTATSILLALVSYGPISHFVTSQSLLSEKVAPFVVFLLLIVFFEAIGTIIIALTDQYVMAFLYRVRFIALGDKVLGIIPSVVLSSLFITLILLLPITVPMSPMLKDDVQQSLWGKYILPKAYANIPKLERIANRLPTQGLLYIIPRSPGSEETIPLQLPQALTLTPDEQSENAMLAMVNQERIARGLKPFVLRKDLVPVARAHSRDMFERHYFSHVNPEGETPFNRMEKAGINFMIAGENLAYAPNVDIAHEGLMNSPGHRENILRPEFGHIGIGVIDGSIYGKMFSQEFTD